jgi:Domain of unknown function (DUF6431)
MIIVHLPNFIQRVIKNSEGDFYHVIHGCRHCGYGGNLHRHASYHRTIICKEITAKVKIQRVICPDCRKTHSLIPSDLIPYFQHTLETIISLLELIKVKKDSYSKILKKFKDLNLSFDLGHLTLYIKRFKVNLSKITYYYRVYCDIFLEPNASAADIISKLRIFELCTFNLNYFNKMPNYFLSRIIKNS